MRWRGSTDRARENGGYEREGGPERETERLKRIGKGSMGTGRERKGQFGRE